MYPCLIEKSLEAYVMSYKGHKICQFALSLYSELRVIHYVVIKSAVLDIVYA